MAMNARPRSETSRRVAIYVPVHVGTFLDLVCKYGLLRKGALVDQVWATGIEVLFGLTQDEIGQRPLTIPSDIYQEEDVDLRTLAELLCGVEE
jgi:hypothetical protein